MKWAGYKEASKTKKYVWTLGPEKRIYNLPSTQMGTWDINARRKFFVKSVIVRQRFFVKLVMVWRRFFMKSVIVRRRFFMKSVIVRRRFFVKSVIVRRRFFVKSVIVRRRFFVKSVIVRQRFFVKSVIVRRKFFVKSVIGYWSSTIVAKLSTKARQIFLKTNIFYLLIRTRTCAYQGVRNVRFSVSLLEVCGDPDCNSDLASCKTHCAKNETSHSGFFQ